VFFTENIYEPFAEELKVAKTVTVVKKPTIKDSQVNLSKSSISTSTNDSQTDLRSSVIFESSVTSSRIIIDDKTEEFSSKIKSEGTAKLESVVEESAKMRKNAEEIFHAFSEVNRIFSGEYAKGVLPPKESALISTAEFQARSYKNFAISVYYFAGKVLGPSKDLFDNNKIKQQSTIEFNESHAKLIKFDDLDMAAMSSIRSDGVENYSILYRAMSPELRQEYIKTRYSEELKDCYGLPVSQFIDIASKALNLNETEISEVESYLKSEEKPVEILDSSSFIDELESA
jgi:hypothetical protein